jgi:hypothetical protein
MAQMTEAQLANLIRTGTPEQKASAMAQLRAMTSGRGRGGAASAMQGGIGALFGMGGGQKQVQGGGNPYAKTAGGSGAMMSMMWGLMNKGNQNAKLPQGKPEPQKMAVGGMVGGKGAGMPVPGAQGAMQSMQRVDPRGIGAMMPPGMAHRLGGMPPQAMMPQGGHPGMTQRLSAGMQPGMPGSGMRAGFAPRGVPPAGGNMDGLLARLRRR